VNLLNRLFEANCEETSEHMSEHLEGELRGMRRVRVARHLSHCPLCSAVLRSLANTVEQLRSLGRVGFPSSTSSTADAVVGRIRREAAEPAG
jgi:predicted anti-sigma-YlaC factor YlaD